MDCGLSVLPRPGGGAEGGARGGGKQAIDEAGNTVELRPATEGGAEEGGLSEADAAAEVLNPLLSVCAISGDISTSSQPSSPDARPRPRPWP